MPEDKIQLYCGTGNGRSAAAIGHAVRYACEGKNVFMIRFLKGRAGLDTGFLKKLEPEIKIFSFDKFNTCYNDLSPQEQEEERLHFRNGLNFAKKVLLTDECDVLILDEILDLVAMGIAGRQEVLELMDAVGDDMVMIMTGSHRCEQLWPKASRVTEVTTLKEAEKIPSKRFV